MIRFDQNLDSNTLAVGLGAEVSEVYSTGGVSMGEPDIVSLVIVSSQRTMNIYGSE